MARYLGKSGSLLLGGAAVGEVKSFDVTLTRDIAESIAIGDTWKASDYGDGSWSGSVTAHMDPDIAGQVSIRAALIAGTKMAVAFYVEGATSGDFELSGQVLIADAGISNGGNGDYQEATFSFTGDGAPVIGTV
jgi:hypothetical protein